MHSHPETTPEFWHYIFFHIGFPAALFLNSTLFTAQLLQSSDLLHGSHLPITYVPSSSNARLPSTIAISTAAHSRWAFATQTKYFLFLMFPILPSAPLFCSSPLSKYPPFLKSLLKTTEMTAIGQFWPFTWKSQCVFLKFLRAAVKNQHTLVISAKNVAQTPEIKWLGQYVLIGLFRYR